jgi:uncharacterized protein (TIGR03067 family)
MVRRVVVGLSCAALLSCSKHEATAADFDKIQKGMSRAQVESALSHLGKPKPLEENDLIEYGADLTVVRWGSHSRAVFAAFDAKGQVRQRALRLPEEQRDEAWDMELPQEVKMNRPRAAERAEPIPAGIDAREDVEALTSASWKMTQATVDGRPMMNDVRWTFELDTLKISLRGGPPVKQAFRLDPDKDPKRIALGLLLLPDGRGANQSGIYRIDGDELTVCLDMGGHSYPASFDAPKGSHFMLQRFKRE